MDAYFLQLVSKDQRKCWPSFEFMIFIMALHAEFAIVFIFMKHRK